jgi:lysophospholipase L1-like esterase
VVRNLRADETRSPETAIDFVDRTVGMNQRLKWKPENGAPDAVIINLGTNDFSSLPQPDFDVFVGAYIDLLKTIRERYPQTTILAMSGPLMLDPAPAAIRAAVDGLRSSNNDEAVHFVEIVDTLDPAGADYGCDWHPNVQGHSKIADQLVPVLAEKMNW